MRPHCPSIGIGLGLSLRSVGAGFKGLLNKFPADLGLSLQRINNDTTNVVEARRSTDNALKDFTAAEITNGTLLDWVGTGAGFDAFARTVYDQSGNGRNATQTTAAAQPRLVKDGVIEVDDNGKPTMVFDGVDDYLDVGAPSYLANPFSVFSAAEPNGTAPDYICGVSPTTLGADFFYVRYDSSAGGKLQAFLRIDGNTADDTYTSGTTEPAVSTLLVNSSNLSYALNGGTLENVSTAALTLSNFDQSRSLYIGAANAGSNLYGQCKINEIIIYASDQSANRAAIEADIAKRYAIELAT